MSRPTTTTNRVVFPQTTSLGEKTAHNKRKRQVGICFGCFLSQISLSYHRTSVNEPQIIGLSLVKVDYYVAVLAEEVVLPCARAERWRPACAPAWLRAWWTRWPAPWTARWTGSARSKTARISTLCNSSVPVTPSATQPVCLSVGPCGTMFCLDKGFLQFPIILPVTHINKREDTIEGCHEDVGRG